MSSISQAWKTYHSSLLWVMLRKLLAKFVRIETLIVYRHVLPGDVPHAGVRNPAIRILPVDEQDPELLRLLCLKYPEKGFHERLRRAGQQCFVALHDKGIAAYAWATNSALYLDEIACTYPVSAGEIFIYDCFVEPEYRGAGIYPAMLEAIVRDNHRRKADLTRILIAASSLNRASIRGISKAGFAEEKRIRYVECLQKQKWWGFSPVEA